MSCKPAWLRSINRSDKPCKATHVKQRQEKDFANHPRSACRVPQPHQEFLSETVFEPEARSMRPASWANARGGEERRKQSRAPGGLFFCWVFFFGPQKKTPRGGGGGGGGPPAGVGVGGGRPPLRIYLCRG